MNTTPEELNLDEAMTEPDDMDAFVKKAMFRDAGFNVHKIGGTAHNPKFTHHTINFKGPNWFGWVRIVVIGQEWRTQVARWYTVSVFVRRIDGPMFMEVNDKTELVVDYGKKLLHGTIKEVPAPESLYPHIEAALDEEEARCSHYYADSGEAVGKIALSIAMTVTHYLKGANLLGEAIDHQAEARRELGVTESLAITEVDFGPEDFEAYGKVASDIQYASAWSKKDGGINNRYVNVWVCEIRCPLGHPSNKEITGDITAFQGSEGPWLLRAYARDGYSKGTYIIGYFKTEPTMSVLDKVRDAALHQIKAYMSGDDCPGNGLNIVKQFTLNIQAHIKDDPEVLLLNYPPERTDESANVDVGEWVGDFLKYDGIGEWKDRPFLTSGLVDFDHSSILEFKFPKVRGHVTFSAFRFTDQSPLGYTQEISIEISDELALDTVKVSYASSPGSWLKFKVPNDQFDKAKAALREFVATYVKPLATNIAMGNANLAGYKSAVSRKLLNTMSPWFVQHESLDINPDDLWREVEKHGGAPLEWKRKPHPEPLWVLRFPWMDRSHIGTIGMLLSPELGDNVYLASLRIMALDDESQQYAEEISDSSMVRLDTPAKTAKFQQGAIDLAIKLMATYNAGLQIRISSPMYGRQTDDFIRNEWNLLVDSIDLRIREALNPEEFLKDFDIDGVMLPWYRADVTEPAYTSWKTKLKHPHRTRPFADQLEVYIDAYPATVSPSGAPVSRRVQVCHYYRYRGSHSKELSPITVNYAEGEKVVAVVDNVLRSLVLPKIAKNDTTPGGLVYYIRALKRALTDAGMVVETATEGLPTPRIEEAVTGLVFRSECRGTRSGQTDMTLYADLDDEVVGRIDYCVFNDEVHIQYIKTQPDHRRQGIATALAKKLQSEYPNAEIEWGGSTGMGTPFIASLNREFEPEPQYGPLKKAYDDAKAERDSLQAEFDAWTAADRGKLPPDMLLKGARLNELDDFLWDLEDKLRDLKPGRWMIREAQSPDDFYAGFEMAHAVTGWTGHDQNTAISTGSYLYVNKSGVLGPYRFNVYIRPNNRQTLAGDCSFHISCWVSLPDGSYTHEAPDIWIRLSSTKGQPSFQPGTIDDFMSGLKDALTDIAPRVMPQAQSSIDTVNVAMFGAMRSWIVKAGWQGDVDKHSKSWDLYFTGVGESLQEGIEWTPDDIASIAAKATTCCGEWQHLPYNNANSGETAEDWVFHIHAPYGRLHPDNNYIRLRFYIKDPGQDYIRIGMEAHFVAPYNYRHAEAAPVASNYDHINLTRQYTIPPGTEADFRKDVESEFFRTIGDQVTKSPPSEFRLRDLQLKVKSGFTRLQRRWWVPGSVWI